MTQIEETSSHQTFGPFDTKDEAMNSAWHIEGIIEGLDSVVPYRLLVVPFPEGDPSQAVQTFVSSFVEDPDVPDPEWSA